MTCPFTSGGPSGGFSALNMPLGPPVVKREVTRILYSWRFFIYIQCIYEYVWRTSKSIVCVWLLVLQQADPVACSVHWIRHWVRLMWKDKSWHTHQRVTSHVWIRHVTRVLHSLRSFTGYATGSACCKTTCHGTHISESCHTCKRVMSHIHALMSFFFSFFLHVATNIPLGPPVVKRELWHTYRYSCHTCECVMSHIRSKTQKRTSSSFVFLPSFSLRGSCTKYTIWSACRGTSHGSHVMSHIWQQYPPMYAPTTSNRMTTTNIMTTSNMMTKISVWGGYN